MGRRRIAVALALTLVLAAAAVPASAAFVVRAEGTSFRPARAEVDRGTRVVWRAVGATHTVTAFGGGWSKDTRITAGQQTGFTFQQRGTFRYRCKIHSTLSRRRCNGMCGRVVVG